MYRRSCLVQLHYTETYSCIADHSACPYLFYISIKKTTVSHVWVNIRINIYTYSIHYYISNIRLYIYIGTHGHGNIIFNVYVYNEYSIHHQLHIFRDLTPSSLIRPFRTTDLPQGVKLDFLWEAKGKLLTERCRSPSCWAKKNGRVDCMSIRKGFWTKSQTFPKNYKVISSFCIWIVAKACKSLNSVDWMEQATTLSTKLKILQQT